MPSPGIVFNYDYKYNGKEFQDELGLNLYDYGARNYDPAIGRWTTPDPLLNDLDFTFNPNDVDEDDEEDLATALQTSLANGEGIYNTDNLNPYGYGYNNPVSFDDPDGRCPICLVLAALLFSQSAEAPTGNNKIDTQSRNATAGNNSLIPSIIAGGGIIGNAYKANSIRRTIEKSKEKSKEKTTETKKVPNPNGKNGGEKHQGKINEYEGKLQDKGYQVTRERKVNTEGGNKNTRYTDLTAKKDGKTLNVQVGKQNKNGTPVVRERKAIQDINNSTKGAPNGSNRTIFVPYN